MRWPRLVGVIQLYVSFAKEPYKRDDILHKRPILFRSLLIVATPYAQSVLSALQCVAVRCSVLQCVAVRCSVYT